MPSSNVTLFGVFLLSVLAAAIYCRTVFANRVVVVGEPNDNRFVINAAGGVFAVAAICAGVALIL